MLSSDPKRLRVLGIDLHSRLRRRAAVVLTYVVYILGVAALCTFIEYNQRLWLQYICVFARTIKYRTYGNFSILRAGKADDGTNKLSRQGLPPQPG